MRVSPRRPAPTTESTSFQKLFRSILVAAFAAEGCSEVVTTAPDAAAPDAATPDVTAPDAGPPFENVCPVEEGYYYPLNAGQLDVLRSAAGLDYFEMRTINRLNNWDGGLNPNAMWMTVGTSGTRCATATPMAACEAAFAAVGNDPSFSSTIFVYTRGNEVGALRRVEDFARLFAPIDTAAEAAFIAVYGHLVAVPCASSARPIASGGWEILGTTGSCSGGNGGPLRITRVLVRVAPDGTSTATTLEATDGGYCPVPGRRPDGLRDARPDAPDAVGRWLARATHMEAASVFAFESLARELTELGAPATLVEAARRSADDERRHARMMGRLARRAGAAVPPAEVAAPRARTAFAIARENAVEGCVHETWAAMEALAQASRAARPDVAATMGAIADDELRHASLAWAVAAWLEPRLSPDERAAVREAREDARAALEAGVARGYDAELVEALGLPSPAVAARLAASLHAALA